MSSDLSAHCGNVWSGVLQHDYDTCAQALPTYHMHLDCTQLRKCRRNSHSSLSLQQQLQVL